MGLIVEHHPESLYTGPGQWKTEEEMETVLSICDFIISPYEPIYLNQFYSDSYKTEAEVVPQ